MTSAIKLNNGRVYGRNALYPLQIVVTLLVVTVRYVLTSSPGASSRAMILTDADFPLKYRIQEEVARGSFVADIARDSGLRERYLPEVLSLLEFRILSPPPLPFVIDTKSGIIRTDGVVDRDSLMMCKDRSVCEIALDIAVRPAQYFQIIKVAIELEDINDNAPHFRENYTIIYIRESTSVGSSFAISPASDLDSPRYAVQTYELVPETLNLGLSVTIRRDGSLDARLVVQHPLDREVEDRYRLQLIAYDGGDPPKSASLYVIVNVLDSNDNSPIFMQSIYSVNVSENIAIGTILLRVKATDRDIGQNAEISYRLSPQTIHLYGQVFAIDSRTGDVSVRGLIDYEAHSVYQLGVVAQDHGPDSLPADTSVIVRVFDVNDNAPVISINTLAARRTNNADVLENLASGSFVAHVSVSDLDVGENGHVSCTLNESSEFNLNERYPTEFQLVTAASFDRELADRYNVKIVCSDGGLPPSVTRTTLHVNIIDTNDNPPRFSNSTYVAHLIENNYVGASVLSLTAEDADLDKNAEFHFALGSPLSSTLSSSDTTMPFSVSSTFEVDSSGRVTVRVSVDRESQSSFKFLVLAIDHGVPAMTSSATIVVIVDNVNDVTPTFSHVAYSFSIEENQPDEIVVGTVSAEDGDITSVTDTAWQREETTGLKYSLLTADQATRQRFAIEDETGNIYTTSLLDREQQSVYRFTVHVTDQGQPPLTSTASVTVYVQDINDNDPVCDLTSNLILHVSPRLPVGHTILQLSCHDLDIDLNSRLRYRFIDADDQTDGDVINVFSINPESGEISTKVPLSDADTVGDDSLYRLRVVVSDAGSPSRSTVVSLIVQINASATFIDVSPLARDPVAQVVSQNILVVLAVVIGSAALTLGALITAAALRRRSRRGKTQRYKVRMEALRALTAKEAAAAAAIERVPLTSVLTSSSNREERRGTRKLCTGPDGSKISCNGNGTSHGTLRNSSGKVSATIYDCHSQRDAQVPQLDKEPSPGGRSGLISLHHTSESGDAEEGGSSAADSGINGHSELDDENPLPSLEGPRTADKNSCHIFTAGQRRATTPLPPPPPPPPQAPITYYGRLPSFNPSNGRHSVPSIRSTGPPPALYLQCPSTSPTDLPISQSFTPSPTECHNPPVFYTQAVVVQDDERRCQGDDRPSALTSNLVSSLRLSETSNGGSRNQNSTEAKGKPGILVRCRPALESFTVSGNARSSLPRRVTLNPEPLHCTTRGRLENSHTCKEADCWNSHPDGYIV